MESSTQGEGREGGSKRARLVLAGGTVLVVLAAAGTVLALSGGDDETEHRYSAAPARCVNDWNQDAAARYVGRHQFLIHRYEQVQVVTLTGDGSAVASATDPGATCAIVFASVSLDPEFAAAAMIERPAAWFPLSAQASPDRLAELQSDARAAYNGRLAEDGTITALPPPAGG